MKKLYKSNKDKVLSGVIGGLGEYFEIDSTLLRLGFIVFLLITGVFPGVLLYIAAALIIPSHPAVRDVPHTEQTPESK